MAKATDTPAPKSNVFAIEGEYLDAIQLSGGPGRQAKPSVYLTEVKSAKLEEWLGIKATAANTVDVISRELRKAVKQLNKTLDDASKIKVETRPRKDHPKLGAFVAFRVMPDPVTADAPPTGE